MDSQVLGQVRRLMEAEESRGARVSRNRHHRLFSGAQGMRLWRLYRLYRSLWEELATAAREPRTRVSAEDCAGGLAVTVEDDHWAYRRRALVPDELAGLFRARLDDLGLGPLAQGGEQ